jgi:excisionase family DNA binding protein
MTKEHDVDGPVWFSIREAATYLQVGEPTIYRWMRDARITYRKVGDSTRFLQSDLDAVIEVFPSTKGPLPATERCPACRHDVLVDGDLRSTGLVHFHPSHTRFWTLKDSSVTTRALMCARCGTITLKGDLAKLAALQKSTDAVPPAESPEPKEE